MKMENRPANAPQFTAFDMKKSIRENISGCVVIEFPTLIVVCMDQLEMRKNYNIVGLPPPDPSDE